MTSQVNQIRVRVPQIQDLSAAIRIYYERVELGNFGIATVAVITVLVYIIAELIKRTRLDSKWLPGICGICGILLGIVALYIGVPDFPATDPVTAAAVGGVSGLAATGINQVLKQLKQ